LVTLAAASSAVTQNWTWGLSLIAVTIVIHALCVCGVHGPRTT
jgi:hypothetical protein